MNFDFELLLVVLALASGGIWAVDKLLFAAKRVAAASGEDVQEPVVVEYANSLFPVFLIVLVLRSFVGEPYEIPSGSMKPTLLVGDYIIVNKFKYGLKLPVVDTPLIDFDAPQRGDVFVFRYPVDNETNYIKRVVGVPGDRVRYVNKQLFINGVKAKQQAIGTAKAECPGFFRANADIRREMIGDAEHDIYVCNLNKEGEISFTVPEGNYLAFGDNRDNSNDSRYWGYVPKANLVGKAVMIWFSSDATKGWFSGERFRWERIGTLLN